MKRKLSILVILFMLFATVAIASAGTYSSMSNVSTGNVYMYDVTTAKTTQITNSGCAWSPSIYNNNIVYADSKAFGNYNYEEGDVYLYSMAIKPVAAFTASKTSSVHPTTVIFTYTGTGTTPMTYKWNFGEGSSVTTTSKAISHTYKNKGVFTVSVTATNDAGYGSLSKSKYITVK